MRCYHIFEQNHRGKWYNKIKSESEKMARNYSKQLKASVVNKIINKHRSTSKVVAEMNIPLKTVENWITLYNKDNTVFDIVQLSLTEQVDMLKKEVTELKKDNDILKKRLSYWQKGVNLYESIQILSKEYYVSSNINKSAYSYWLNTGIKTTDCKLDLYHAIIEVYTNSKGIYGAPKITNVLNQRGFNCSVSKVSRAMKTLGIMSIVSKKFRKKKSSLTGEEKALIVNLIKGLKVERVNQVWTTDISYIKTKKQGNFYLIAYIDYYSKKVAAWDLAAEQKAEQLIEVLKQAVRHRKPSPELIYLFI